MNNNRTYTHEAVLALFETSTQTSINSFSKTTKWILIIFGANWSWGRACSVSVFCFLLLFVGNYRKTVTKLKTHQKTLRVSLFSPHGGPAGNPSRRQYRHRKYINMWIYNFLPPGSFLVTFQPQDLQVSTQSGQYKVSTSGASKSSRNGTAYEAEGSGTHTPLTKK